MDYFKKISRCSSPDSRFFVDQATEPVPTYVTCTALNTKVSLVREKTLHVEGNG